MFFDRKRIWYLFRSSGFVIFLVLLITGFLLLLALLFFMKERLYQEDRQLVVQEVERYIKKSGIGSPRRLPNHLSIKGLNDLGNLSFIKLARRGEQILLVSEDFRQLDPNDLLHLPESVYENWGFLISKDEPFVTINYRTGDFALEAAAKAKHYQTYQTLKKFGYKAFVIYLIGAGGLCLLLNWFADRAIRKTSRQVAELANNPLSPPLAEEGNGGAFDMLHTQINGLVRQNRKLVTEIQDSLDNVAHDLRTPVTRLRSVAEYGLQSDDVSRLKDALADCLEESEQIAAMLKIMMSVAEAESGTMNLDLQPVELGAGLRDVVDLYEYVAEDKGVTVELHCPESLYVNMDSVRMRQVWANLLDNAVKYGRVGGHVKIDVIRKDDKALVSFVDDGIGIADSEIHKIWERLYRGDRSRSEKGLGLGLNYVKAVVEAHQGSVSVSSVLNNGTEFKVELPLGAPAPGGA